MCVTVMRHPFRGFFYEPPLVYQSLETLKHGFNFPGVFCFSIKTPEMVLVINAGITVPIKSATDTLFIYLLFWAAVSRWTWNVD